MKKHLLTALGMALAIAASPAMADVPYVDDLQFNLCSIRGAVAATSSGRDASGSLHPAGFLDTRFTPEAGGTAWWRVAFPDTYNVSSYTFVTYGNLYTSMTYQVETSLTGEDGSWVPRTGPITLTPGSDGFVTGLISGSFAAVEAKFVRLNFLSYAGYGEAIVGFAQITGLNNNIAVNPGISLVQPWAGVAGTPLLTDRDRTDAEVPALTDAFVGRELALFGTSYYVGQDGPAQMTVPLNDLYAIHAVGITTMGNPSDDRKAKDVRIYISPDAEGDNWIPVTGIITLPNSPIPYHEIELNGVHDAQRVRFDILNTHNADGWGYMGQLYVYGGPIPEPATMSLLVLGGLAMLRRRK